MKKLAVIGSINMDVVTSVERFPQPGETLTGTSFSTIPGGKGANQAVALGRLGVPVRMAGSVGDDAFGESYLRNFRENGVDTALVRVCKGQTTGTASIEVNAEGENHIIVVPAANGECDMQWLEETLPALANCDIFLLQHEIPLPVVFEAIRRLHALGKTVILDPAPAAAVPEDVLSMIDYITPNESELRAITPTLGADADVQARVSYLLGLGVGCVINKSGGDGAYVATRAGGIKHVPGFKVKVVDTTAAGDTFNAGFAAGLALGLPLEESVMVGNAAAGLSVTAFGAQGGMPRREQLLTLLGEEWREKLAL
ncbi:MAG TPA: ribokinase [Candidatus Pullichristensenella stercorigallinarum]|uniref:Ribokinase n=1 Tax=Candidatus Pullichristensenella stercorigallinarum TaxID=2840909 RepID=A0A9D1CW79_9FIRM|nr:ribokinase [Candidatus Pullichristensenella stercorigallinarum]